MKKLIAIFGLILFTATSAQAADMAHAGDIMVSKAWGRASTGMNRPAGVFVMIKSNGGADKLVSASTPVAGRAELHTHLMEDGMMKMRQVHGGIDIPAGGMVMLKPGGLHIMVFELKEMLKEGTMFPMTLNFEKGGSATVTVHVGKAGGMMQHDHSKKHEEQMKEMGHDMKNMDHGNMDHSNMKSD